MNKRTSSLPVLVVVAVLALVLGSVGTAVAGQALTKSKVKHIATKVVKKQAPTLSVASAANATALAGKAAPAYLNTATVYTSTTFVGALTHTFTLPLAPGFYAIGYSVLLIGGTGYSFCNIARIRPASTPLVVADDTSETTTSAASVSGFGVVDVQAGDTVRLSCTSSTSFSVQTAQPAQIVVQPLDSVTTPTPIVAGRATAGRGN
jgi:hypothetical protein